MEEFYKRTVKPNQTARIHLALIRTNRCESTLKLRLFLTAGLLTAHFMLICCALSSTSVNKRYCTEYNLWTSKCVTPPFLLFTFICIYIWQTDVSICFSFMMQWFIVVHARQTLEKKPITLSEDEDRTPRERLLGAFWVWHAAALSGLSIRVEGLAFCG